MTRRNPKRGKNKPYSVYGRHTIDVNKLTTKRGKGYSGRNKNCPQYRTWLRNKANYYRVKLGLNVTCYLLDKEDKLKAKVERMLEEKLTWKQFENIRDQYVGKI